MARGYARGSGCRSRPASGRGSSAAGVPGRRARRARRARRRRRRRSPWRFASGRPPWVTRVTVSKCVPSSVRRLAPRTRLPSAASTGGSASPARCGRPLAQRRLQRVRVGVRHHPADGRRRRRLPLAPGAAPRAQRAQLLRVQAGGVLRRRHRPRQARQPRLTTSSIAAAFTPVVRDRRDELWHAHRHAQHAHGAWHPS